MSALRGGRVAEGEECRRAARFRGALAALGGEARAGASTVLLVGSSILAQWRGAGGDLGVSVDNRAVGGFRTSDLLSALPRVLPPAVRARVVCLYVGSNDLKAGDLAAHVAARLATIAAHVRATGASLVLVAALRSPDRVAIYGEVDRYNAAMRAMSSDSLSDAAGGGGGGDGARVYYADPNPLLEQDASLFQGDGTHLRRAGYAALALAVRPVLERALAARSAHTSHGTFI